MADSFHEHAPYYEGTRAVDGPVARLAVQYQRGGSQSSFLDPSNGEATPVARLLQDMNDYLDSLTGVPPLIATAVPGTPPDVHFGCEVDLDGECTNGPAAPFDYGTPRMRLAVGRPSPEWTRELAAVLDTGSAASVLVITLEVGQYWPQQTNWRGSKAVELGSGHVAQLPWLSSLETPVSVVQLTGALVSREGRALRIGAEGMLARRTGIIAAGFGAQALITDEDIEELRTERRSDLPGSPLVWEVALRTLVEQLTGSAHVSN